MNTVKYFKALADETRLRLYYLLMDFEFNVNEIVSVMGMGQSRISRHLKILTDTGLLASRRDGSFVYYRSIRSDELADLIRFIEKSAHRHGEFSGDRNRAETLVRERKMRMQRFFNDIADKWDRMKTDVFGDFDLTGRIIEHTGKCRVAVDMGCGTGELLPALAAHAAQVIGVDSSPNMLAQARKKAGNRQDRIDLRLGEMEHLPVRDGEADLVVANMVLHHLLSPAAGIQEAWRVLASGGRFLIADFEKHNLEMVREVFGDPWLGFDRSEIETWLADAGFSIAGMETHPVLQGLRVTLAIAEKT